MSLGYKINILQALADKGYTVESLNAHGFTYKIQSSLRKGNQISLTSIGTICDLLKCDIDDILINTEISDEIPVTQMSAKSKLYIIDTDMLLVFMVQDTDNIRPILVDAGLDKCSIARVLIGEPVRWNTLKKICVYLDCEPEDISTVYYKGDNKND